MQSRRASFFVFAAFIASLTMVGCNQSGATDPSPPAPIVRACVLYKWTTSYCGADGHKEIESVHCYDRAPDDRSDFDLCTDRDEIDEYSSCTIRNRATAEPIEQTCAEWRTENPDAEYNTDLD